VSCIKAIKDHSEQLFSKRSSLLSLWQDISENFYPERADFTTIRNVGDEMARNLMTSYPVIARRQLGDSFGAMLRPSAKEWFKVGTNRPDKEDTVGKQWLEWAGKFAKNVMYDRRGMFSRATKEADHDFAAFGQACLSIEMNPQRNGLLYRSWHLRDVAWMEGPTGAIETVYRKWKPTCAELVKLFPKTVHQKVREKMVKEPFAEVNVIHCVMPSEDYAGMEGGKQFRQPFVSCYIDVDNDCEMECVGAWTAYYVIPRWSTVSGSQYAHSPAVVAGLPDGRLIQQVTRVLLEAGEKATNPPMLAVQEAIRGDVSIYAGGITWVDAEYDERLGEVLRPLTQDKSGLGFGMEMMQDLRTQLSDAFYLSKLNLPPVGGPDMTAYEVGQRVQEFIRNALPLFEPMEQDYNGQVCDQTLELMLHASPELRNSVPKNLQGAEIRFTFESPLKDAIEKIKVGQFMEAQQVLAAAIQLDPSVALVLDNQKATRDVLGAVVPAAWLRTDAEAQAMAAEQQAQQQSAQLLAMMEQGSVVAKNLGEASPTAGQGGAGGVL
jgi:hypothetical protein